MIRKIFTSFAIALMVAGFVSVARADSWPLPKKEKYYSPDKRFYLEVIPKKLESQLEYFSDEVDGKENAGAVKGAKDNYARGAFYARRPGGGYARRWQIPLVNEVAPVNALVSRSGDYVVTFDNWHSVGHGDDVVVIYNAQGALVKKFGLEDLLTEGDIETFQRSVSSMRWGGKHYIDESQGLLVLKIVSNGKSSWEESATFHELKIELATGRPLEPKRDLFPQPRVFASVEAVTTPAPSEFLPGQPSCSSSEESFDSSDAARIPVERIYAHAKNRPLPPYPPLAKAARAESPVVVEVLISKTGDVICARALAGHPLLQKVAVMAALKWTFAPFEASGDAVKAVGPVIINFKLSVRDMNPNNQPRD
jgi:hypothetical protein